MEIKIICIGKVKEKYLEDGINEYLKRLKPFVKIGIIELKEFNTDVSSKNIEEEGKLILSHIDDEFVITLEIEGNNIDSVELANMIEKHSSYNSNDIVFVIGGSDGLSNDVKKRSNFKLSFGKMTYPHQLMRLILTEQIYRAYTIINNKKYHK